MGFRTRFEVARGPARLAACVRLLAGTSIAMGMLSGCATVSSRSVESPSGRGEALYEGQPELVYATEFPVASAAEARERAEAAVGQSDLDRALYFYVQAVSLDPADTEALYMIGAIHEHKKNRSLAARAFAKVIEIDPRHGLALQGLGVAYFEAHELELAEATLQKAIAVDPGLWRAHNVLGVLADSRGEHAPAIAHFSAALEARPGTASILNNRGYSRYLAGDFKGAEADFLAALAADASYDRARRNVGLLYARKGEYQTALRELAQVSSRHAAANDVGYIAMLSGDHAVAETLFREAIRLSPRHYSTAEENLATLRELQAETSMLVVER